MYKALDIRDDSEIVILDSKWLRIINQLREFDHQDFLVCQGCKQPVRVRAGKKRRAHFAHKHLENCNYADESTVLRNARAILYEWLVGKFGDKVSIEKKVDGVDLFRPIDCWVNQGSVVFAYWIFDSTIKPEKREVLQSIAQKSRVHINWVFTLEMLRTQQDHRDRLVLSTTEREFIKRSKYDMPFTMGQFTNGSLHYLDTKNRKMITFRSLSLFHEPQIYNGFHLTSELEKGLVSPQNGEFVHDGEHDRLQKYEQHSETISKSPNSQWVRHAFQKNPDFIEKTLKNWGVPSNNTRDNFDNPLASNSSLPKTGVCIFCGEITEDWWWYDGKTGQCKCKPCSKLGKF